MSWEIVYDERVEKDLISLGNPIAKRVLKAINEKLTTSPDLVGSPLRRPLTNCRKLRVGDTRVIYKVNDKIIQVLIIAIGPRRNDEIYKLADKRIEKK